MALKKYVLDSIEVMIQDLIFDKYGLDILEFIVNALNARKMQLNEIVKLHEKKKR